MLITVELSLKESVAEVVARWLLFELPPDPSVFQGGNPPHEGPPVPALQFVCPVRVGCAVIWGKIQKPP